MNEKELSFYKKMKSLVVAGTIMAIGIIIFKYAPMMIWGRNILYDASLHIVLAIFTLYVLWYFIDQNKNLRIPYYVFSLAVVIIISIQRIISDAHNDIGLLAGLLISIIGVIASRWDYFKGKFKF